MAATLSKRFGSATIDQLDTISSKAYDLMKALEDAGIDASDIQKITIQATSDSAIKWEAEKAARTSVITGTVWPHNEPYRA
jgi:hypothetical protein